MDVLRCREESIARICSSSWDLAKQKLTTKPRVFSPISQPKQILGYLD